MPLALLTGRPDLLGSAGAALGRAGFDVVVGETPPPPSAGPFDCYVQLPCDRRDAGRGAGRSATDLVGRIDALAAVAGRLGPDASVILGIDDTGGSGPDPGPAISGRGRPGPVPVAADLLAAVALALLEDLGRPATRLAVLPVADLCPASEPTPVATVQWETPTPPLVSAP